MAKKSICIFSVSSDSGGVRRLGTFFRQIAAIFLSALLTFQPTLLQAQQITPDTSAPVINQPKVGTAPNGIPLVDIVTPNGQGLSHNKYNSFNVDTPGLILNNHNGEVGKSSLGGVTPGNPNLSKSGPASIILNEVTTQNRSALKGPIEVFGGKADVIIANPNGITCDGCGFVNSPRATLTTGVPEIGANGHLNGFNVTSGDVTFGEKGGNFASGNGGVDLFDVVSRSVRVDGPVYGKDLRLTAGRNKFNYTTGKATVLDTTAGTPEYAIDGSALGTMQANRIRMVVTEKGAGVRMRGDMAANAGELSLSSDGKVSIGNASASEGVTLRSRAEITAARVTSKKRIIVQADKGITLQTIAADQDIALDGGIGLLTIAGELIGLANVQLMASGDIFAGSVDAGGTASLISASGNITIAGAAKSAGDLTITTVGSLAGASLVSFNNITLNAGGDIGVTGNVLAAGNLVATGQSIQSGTMVAGLDFTATKVDPNHKSVLGSSGDLRLTATGGSINAVALLSAGDMKASASAINTSTLLAAGAFKIESGIFTAQNVTGHKAIAITGDTRIAGQLLGGEDVSITGAGISAGGIVSGVDFARMSQSLSTDVVLREAGKLDLNATSGSIQVANLPSAGDLFGRASGDITANAVSHGDLDLRGGNAIGLTGQSLAAGDVSLNAGTLTIDTLVSGVDFAATAASSDGNLRLKAATGKMNLDAAHGSLKAKSLLSGGNLDAHAAQNINYDSLQSFGSASLAADQGAISFDKRTSAQDNLTLTTQTVDLSNNRGQIATAKNLIINATSANFAGSKLTYGGLGLNLTGSADFTGASVRAVSNSGGSGNINIKATTINSSSSTALLAQNDLTLTLSSLANSGQLAAGHDLTFNVADDLANTPTGLIFSGNDAKLYVARNLTNDQGAIMASHDLTIAASANNAKNQSVTNISGLIKAENDALIATDNLTNKRLTNPTWENVLVSDNVVSKFELNPVMLGKPYAQLFSFTGTGYNLFYKNLPKQYTHNNLGALWSQAVLPNGSSYRTHSWEDTWDKIGSGHSKSAPLNWLDQVVPKDEAGNYVLDKDRTSRYFVIHNGKSHDTFYLKYRWVDSNHISQTIQEDRLKADTSPEAMIHAGRNLDVDATTLTNSYSPIEVGGDATLKGSVINNEGVALHRTTLIKCEVRGGCAAYNAFGQRDAVNDLGDGVERLTADVTIGGVPATIKAAGNLDVSGIAKVNNTSAPGSMVGSATLAALSTTGNPTLVLSGLTAGAALFTPNVAFTDLQVGNTGSSAETMRINGAALAAVSKPNSGGFGGTVPGQIFLFETRAAFLDVGKFYGSSYFLNRIGYEPEHDIPFLGDAYFENQLIDTQLRQLVKQGLGKGSFLPGSDSIEQMKLLLDNGIEYTKAHNLKIGEQLTAGQVAALTQSIVIYEKKIIQGVEVLAPVVYLANADKTNLTVAGALISGGSVNMDVGNISNSGAVIAKTDLKIAATNIKANGGSFIAGGNVQLQSMGDLTLSAQSLTIGGTNVLNPNGGVKAGGNASLDAKSNLTLQGMQISAGGDAALTGQNVTFDVTKVNNNGTQDGAGAKVTTGGNLSIAAKDNVNIIGSAAAAGGTLGVTAEHGSVNIVTADLAKDIHGRRERRTSETRATVQKQSELSSGADTTIKASDDILLSGSKVKSGGNTNLIAGDDIDITTAQNQTAVNAAEHSSSKITNTGSEIKAGGSIVVTAGGVSDASIASPTKDDGHDISIIGSKLSAGGKVELKADGDVTIAQAQDSLVTDTQSSTKRVFSSKKATTHIQSTSHSIARQLGIDPQILA